MSKLVGPWRYAYEGAVSYRALSWAALKPQEGLPFTIGKVAIIWRDKRITVRVRDTEDAATDNLNWIPRARDAESPNDVDAKLWCDSLLKSLGYELENEPAMPVRNSNLNVLLKLAFESARASAYEGQLEDWEIDLIKNRILDCAKAARDEQTKSRGR